MAVIKRTTAADLTRDAIVLDLGDLQRQAASIVAAARAEAERILAAARDERRKIVAGAAEEGREAGYAAGLDQGRAEGIMAGREAALAEHRERLASIEAAWTSALEVFRAQRRELVLSAQTDVLRLALAIAERVTRTVVRSNPSVAVSQVEAVLRTVVHPTRLRLRIHPEDRETIAAAMPELLGRCGSDHDVELVDDPSVGRGSCIAVTCRESAGSGDGTAVGGGEMDASIQTQLDRIVAALLPEETRSDGEAAA